MIRLYDVIGGAQVANYNLTKKETIHRLCSGPHNSLLMYTGCVDKDTSLRHLHQLKWKEKQQSIENKAIITVGEIIDVAYGMSFAPDQNVLVITDMHSHKIAALKLNFTEDTSTLVEGTEMLWQLNGSENLIEGKKLHEPWGICCDTETQRVYVAETGNLRVLVLDMCSGGVQQVISMKKYKLLSDLLFFTKKPQLLLHYHERGRNKIVMLHITVQ